MKAMLLSVRRGIDIIDGLYNSYCSENGQLDIREKNDPQRLKDFQTLADTSTERAICSSLKEHYPEIGFFGEENSNGNIDDFAHAPYFILDPLDGTSNFVAHRSYFAISLGYIENQQPCIGVIANPLTGMIVAAEKNCGAFVFTEQNHKGLKLSHIQDSHLKDTQIDCEFSFTSPQEISVMTMLTQKSMGMRKHGSTALDILEMACGRWSALIANNQKPYDIAAGLVIAAETGMALSDWDGQAATLNTTNIVIANPRAHSEIIKLLGSDNDD